MWEQVSRHVHPDLHPDRAGRWAVSRCAEVRRHGRHGWQPRIAALLMAAAALGVLGSGLPGPWRWTAGALAGASLALWSLARAVLPPRVAARLAAADGERRTMRALHPALAAGWRRDADGPALLRGPGGTYLLESRLCQGAVSVDDSGVLTVTPPDRPELAASYPLLAARLRQVAADSGAAPVMVVWGAFPAVTVGGGVTWVPGSELAAWLTAPAQRWPVVGMHRPRVLRALAA